MNEAARHKKDASVTGNQIFFQPLAFIEKFIILLSIFISIISTNQFLLMLRVSIF